ETMSNGFYTISSFCAPSGRIGPRSLFTGTESSRLPKQSKLNLCLAAPLFVTLATAGLLAQTPAASVSIGTVKSISGNSIVLSTDASDTVNVTVQDGARLLRIAP